MNNPTQLPQHHYQRAGMLVALAMLMVMPVLSFGYRPLVLLFVAVMTAILCDVVFARFLFAFPIQAKRDVSSIITAFVVTLLMPASAPYYVAAIAVFCGLLLGKYIFGGTGNNIFNPAALGIAAVTISYPTAMLRYPTPGQILPLSFLGDGAISQVLFSSSPGYTLGVGGTPQIQPMSLLLGDFAGMMGATSILSLLGIALFLCGSKIICFRVLFSALATAGLYAFLLPRGSMGRVDSMIFECTSGVLLFGLIFMATDPQTSPRTGGGKVLFGIFLSVAVMVFRTVRAVEIEFVFVLLIANALALECDRFSSWIFSGRTVNSKDPSR